MTSPRSPWCTCPLQISQILLHPAQNKQHSQTCTSNRSYAFWLVIFYSLDRVWSLLETSGIYDKHIGRCPFQGLLCIIRSIKKWTVTSMFWLLEPRRSFYEWTNSSTIWSKSSSIQHDNPFLCWGSLWSRTLVTSISFSQTHADWSQTHFSKYLCCL